MKRFNYELGEEVKKGDRILYHGEPGEVEFVVAEKIGDPAIDWFLERFPEGGVMIVAKGFGNVFIEEPEVEEDLEFVSREPGNQP